VSGSTIVRCWLGALLNGSVALSVSAAFAEAANVATKAEVATAPSASATRFDHRSLIFPPSSAERDALRSGRSSTGRGAMQPGGAADVAPQACSSLPGHVSLSR